MAYERFANMHTHLHTHTHIHIFCQDQAVWSLIGLVYLKTLPIVRGITSSSIELLFLDQFINPRRLLEGGEGADVMADITALLMDAI